MKLRNTLKARHSRVALLACSAIAAVLAASPALAQDGEALAPNEVEAEAAIEAASNDAAAIVVTGSRVAREGYTAPTPTTMIGVEQIRASASASVADFVNQLPALVGSNTPRIANTGASANVGSNLFNLRSLGVNRTLVLVDGRRVVPSTLGGNVDANLLPQALIQRVDVVTGGASAAWGSDAVAGVVNFVLDHRFTGVMANVQTGITEEGDGRTFKAELTAGARFAEGRGHALLSMEYNDDAGVGAISSRDWFASRKVIANPAFTPTNGEPRLLVRTGVGASNQTSGGLITGPATVTQGGVTRPNPLLNIRFLPGGIPAAYNPGTRSGISAFGGDVEDISRAIELAVPLRYGTGFGRVGFDVTPDITVFAEAAFAKARNDIVARVFERGGNITIQRDNAFLPAAIRAQMTAAGLNNISLGRMFFDFGALRGRNNREQQRYAAGIEGKFGSGWKWDLTAQHGRTDFAVGGYSNNPIIANFNLATDAVVSPTGQIVCRSSIANPTNGCVPLNVIGEGSPSEAAKAYVFGNSTQDLVIKQSVIAANLTGEPFSTWAGPVSIAMGGEYRRESFIATADALSLTNAYFVGNFKPADGRLNVKEGYVEAVVPLLSDQPFAKSLELNGAVRLTDYSLSGSVTTWKVGSTWEVIDGLRLRAVASRDIRAPNLSELFQGGATLNQTVNDPVTGTSYSTRTSSGGNVALVPERADTRSIGVVFQPRAVPGLSLSVDYFKIRIDGAIASLTGQQVIDRCRAGAMDQCAFITRPSANTPITNLRLVPQNLNEEGTSGVDIEGTYRTGLGAGNLTLRSVATYTHRRYLDAIGVQSEFAGTNANESQPSTAVPRWRAMGSATWDRGGFGTTLTGRFISAGKLNNAFTAADIDDNTVPSVFYLDLTARYRFENVGKGTEFYFAVSNLLDHDPPASPNYSTASTIQTGVNGYLYDLLGRQYRVGLRTRF